MLPAGRQPFRTRGLNLPARLLLYARKFHWRKALLQHLAWNVQQRQQFVIPIQSMDVKKQGAGGVRIVRYVDFPAGKFPGQPTVNGAEEQVAFFRFCAGAGHVIEHPERTLVPEK